MREILTRSGFSRPSKNRHGPRVSLVFAQKAEGEKHHTNHTIDNGVIAVDKASLFVSPFLGTFDILSKNDSC